MQLLDAHPFVDMLCPESGTNVTVLAPNVEMPFVTNEAMLFVPSGLASSCY